MDMVTSGVSWRAIGDAREKWCVMIDIANDFGPNACICYGLRFGNKHEGSIPFTRSIDYQLLTQLCRKSAGESSLQFDVFLAFRSSLPEFTKHTESGNRT